MPASARAMRRGHRRSGAVGDDDGDDGDDDDDGDGWDDDAVGTDGRGVTVAAAAVEEEGVAHSTRTQSAAPDTKSSGSCSARAS